MAFLIVFANTYEMVAHCADLCHDYKNQPRIFGCEEEKLLGACEELARTSYRYTYYPEVPFEELKERKQNLLKKIYGIAKAHGLFVKWYGTGLPPYEPEYFLVRRGSKDVAFISCLSSLTNFL